MSDTPTRVTPVPEPPPTPLEGPNSVLAILEGGEEDTTIRRSPYALSIEEDTGPDLSDEVKTFQEVLDRFKQAKHRSCPTWTEVFELLHQMGYQRWPMDAPLPFSPSRTAAMHRETAETKINLELSLDGSGRADIATGIGFFDHMLTLLAKHSLIDLTVQAQGDLHVDAHHTVEDVGICFGKALTQALGDKAGIRRYGSATVPMDETLVTVAVDLSGRPYCVWQAALPAEMLGTFNAPLAEEFWRAVAGSAACNLHVVCHHGRNSHHIIEGVFKAAARALRQAVERDPRMPGVPSTKGIL